MAVSQSAVERILSKLDQAYNLRGNDIKESIRLTEEALQESESIKDSNLIAKSLSRTALFQMIKGNYRLSRELSEKAINFFETIGDEIGIADAKFNIASVYYKTDNYHLGLLYLIDCLQIYKKFQDHPNIGKVYKSLGTIYEYFGDENNAMSAYQETVSHAKMVGDKKLESNAYNPLSGIYIKKGLLDLAMTTAEQSMAMKLESDDIRGYAFAIYARAKVFTAMGKFAEAESDFQEALKIQLQYNDLLGTGMVYRKLGELYLLSNQFDKAMETLTIAKDFSYKNQIAIIKYKSNFHLYQLYKKLDHSAKALHYLEEFHKQKELVVSNQTLTIIDNFELLNKVETMKRESDLQKERAEMLEKKNTAENLANIKQDFLSTMSHEIRTPLNAILTIASLLGSQNQEEEKELVGSLKVAANNLLLLINDILDFTKLDSGKMVLEKTQVNLIELFQNMHKTYVGLANSKKLNFSLSLDPQIFPVYELDETRLSQIMVNLIGNAIKYTDSGYVKLEVSIVECVQKYDKIRISVADSGIGISSHVQEEIFESFSQIQNIRTRKQGGSGLGLAIVKKLVNLFNSEINLISSLGKGSVFYFDLIVEKKKTAIEKTSLNHESLIGKSILLVEDNPINTLVATKLLHKWGINTSHALNGKIAIEQINQEKYDAILMDIHMPEMDGFETTKWIKNNSNINQYTPILALTADITAEYNEQESNNFKVFLRKPIETEKLLTNLIKYISA
jgi:hypothetical protein